MRRPFLKTLLAFLIVLTVVPAVQAEKRIGVIMTGDIPYYRTIHEAFVTELNMKAAGVEETEIILQRPFPNAISWANAARKLIAFDVDLIITYGSSATLAVIDEKSRIPLVYAGLYEPNNKGEGYKNATGCGFRVPLSSILRYLKRLKTVDTLGIVYSSIEEDSVRQYQTIKNLAEQQNIQVQKINIRSQADVGNFASTKADAIFLTGSALVHLWLDDIMDILDSKMIPAADIFPDDSESGVLVTLYQPANQQGTMAAQMAWRILRNEKPDDIDEQVLRDTELVLNLVEAKRIGLDFPIQLLIEATKVIE
jgi:putative ABC transport system substrate-binding protein